MFRIFVIALMLVISSSSLASSSSKFYLKTILGANQMNRMVEKKENLNFKITQDPKASPFIGIGVGYYTNDSTRTDITIDYLAANFINEANNFSYNDGANNILGAIDVKRNAYIYSILLNSYLDVFQRDHYSIFVGAGIGVARIREKTSFLSSGNLVGENGVFNFPLNVDKFNTKVTNNFAYALSLGFSVKVRSNINLEFAYHWKDFGRTKPKANENGDTGTRNYYKSHNIITGIRFDI